MADTPSQESAENNEPSAYQNIWAQNYQTISGGLRDPLKTILGSWDPGWDSWVSVTFFMPRRVQIRALAELNQQANCNSTVTQTNHFV